MPAIKINGLLIARESSTAIIIERQIIISRYFLLSFHSIASALT
jgi:hypothetical protein